MGSPTTAALQAVPIAAWRGAMDPRGCSDADFNAAIQHCPKHGWATAGARRVIVSDLGHAVVLLLERRKDSHDARADLPAGLACIGREDVDDPAISEVWP